MKSKSIYTNGEYYKANPDWGKSTSRWKVSLITNMMADHRLTPTTIYDIGCGAGRLLRLLAANLPEAASFVGYDISPDAIDLAQEFADERISFKLFHDVSEIEEPVDLALVIDVIEHVQDYRRFVSELSRISKWAILHIPLDLSAQRVLREKPLLQGRKDVGHIHYFTEGTALATLAECNLKVVDSRLTCPTNYLPARSLRSAVAKVPRAILNRIAPHLGARLLGGFSLLVLVECAGVIKADHPKS